MAAVSVSVLTIKDNGGCGVCLCVSGKFNHINQESIRCLRSLAGSHIVVGHSDIRVPPPKIAFLVPEVYQLVKGTSKNRFHL